MDRLKKLQAISDRIFRLEDGTLEAEPVRNGLVHSFIDALGYDVSDRAEVVPHFDDHAGIDEGEYLDYAVLQHGHPVIVFECRAHGSELGEPSPRLQRHFAAIQPVVGVVTDGVVYRFHSDVRWVKRMDHRPFLEVDLRDPSSAPLSDLETLGRRRFDPDAVWELAQNRLYTSEIHRVLDEQLAAPSDDLVRVFAARMCPRVFTKRDRDRYARVVRRALRLYVSEGGGSRARPDLPRREPGLPGLEQRTRRFRAAPR